MPYHLRSGLGACRPSRTNVFEDVSAAQDAHQVIVAHRLEILFQPSESPLELEPHNVSTDV